jgi:hypothetical protein
VPTLTAAEYRDREAFMVGLLELTRDLQERIRRADAGRQGELRELAGAVQSVYRGLNGGQVRPGTLHPPTGTDRERIRRVREALSGMR